MVQKLKLKTTELKEAALWLFGFRGADGSMDITQRAITFAPVKEKDWDALDEVLQRLCGLLGEPAVYPNADSERHGVEVQVRPPTHPSTNKTGNYNAINTQRRYYIFDPDWYDVFHRDLWLKYTRRKYTKKNKAVRVALRHERDTEMAATSLKGLGRSAVPLPGGKIQRVI